MYMTNYFETMLLNALRGQTAQAPAALFLSLYLNNPGETGQEGTEVSYAGYQRQPITFSTPAPMNGGTGVENLTDISFPITPVSLGTVTHIGVMDSQAGGNMLLYGEFTESISVAANEAPVIVAGEARWWLIGSFSTAYRTRALNLLRGSSLPGIVPYMALYNGDPESGGSELSGASYERMPVTLSAPQEQTGGQMRTENADSVVFPRAAEPWGTCTHYVLFDAQTVGTPISMAQDTAKEARKGLRFMFDAGEITVSAH